MANSYRDGKVHVMAEMCATCVFRPGNLMQLQPGRLKDLVKQNLKRDTALTCHDTLNTRENAICRGFYDKYETTPLRMAKAFRVVEFFTPKKDRP